MAARGIQERGDDLVPWDIRKQHRWAYPLMMLRAEAGRRAGLEVLASMSDRLGLWLAKVEREGTVIHYDPDTEDGFSYLPRRAGVDLDLIREPDTTTTRPAGAGGS